MQLILKILWNGANVIIGTDHFLEERACFKFVYNSTQVQVKPYLLCHATEACSYRQIKRHLLEIAKKSRKWITCCTRVHLPGSFPSHFWALETIYKKFCHSFVTTWSWYLSMLVCSHGLEQEAMVILEKYQEKKKNLFTYTWFLS